MMAVARVATDNRLEVNVDNHETDDDDLQEIEVVHKLQRAAQYASRQKLQQEAISARENNESQSQTVIDVREQRSQIAIIQMAPPAQNPVRNVVSASTSVVKTAELNASSVSDNVLPSTSQAPARTRNDKRANNQAQKQVTKPPKKKRRHHCTVHGCTYNTPHTKDLARHMRKHTGEKPYNCDRCRKTFTRYDKLVLHIRTHEGYRPFSCHICNHTATDSSSLKKHLRTHTNERPYKCQLCSYSSKDSSQLVVHIRHHTGDSPYTCTFEDCDAAFKTPSDLSRHTRLHTGEKPYKCSYCDYRAAVKCNLNAHMKRHTNPGQKKMKAKAISQVVPEEEDDCSQELETNSNSEGFLPFQYACKLCNFKADTIDQFGTHMTETHPDSNLGMRSKNEKKVGKPRASSKPGGFTDQRNFQCTTCKAAFVCEESLRCHMRQHSSVPNRPANVAPELYTPSRMRVQPINIPHSNFPADNGSANIGYTLHEMQRMPLGHSVITENPAVIGNNNVPLALTQHQQHQVHFEDADLLASHSQNAYVVNYNNTGNFAYRNNVEYNQ